MEMEDRERVSLLGMNEGQMVDVAAVCNVYPSVSISTTLCKYTGGDDMEVEVSIERDGYEEETVPVVRTRYFSEDKQEYWWVVLGDSERNKLFSIKRVTFARDMKTKLKFKKPDAGKYSLQVYLISDTWVGCDQQSDIMRLDIDADVDES